MSRPPVAERPPGGLDADQLGVWRCALTALKSSGLWGWHLRPLLDEYVYALAAADAARAKGWPGAEDRAARRAMALADQLGLTPRGRKAAGISREKPAVDPFAALDELAVRRGAS